MGLTKAVLQVLDNAKNGKVSSSIGMLVVLLAAASAFFDPNQLKTPEGRQAIVSEALAGAILISGRFSKSPEDTK